MKVFYNLDDDGMSKQLCFIIEDNELYLDKVLVSFNRTPIFFTCQDNYNNYYLVLCSDIDNLEYIVEKQSLKNLENMLQGKISMHSILLDCDYFWLIKSGESISEDIVKKKIISKIDTGVLPEKNALLINEDDEQYVKKINRGMKDMENKNGVVLTKDIDDCSSCPLYENMC